MNNKKSTYKTLAEALVFEGLESIDLNLEHLDQRSLSIQEMKKYIKEAFKDATAAADVEAKEVARGWGDAEIENEINWVAKLNLKEFFEPEQVSEQAGKDGDEEEKKEEDC